MKVKLSLLWLFVMLNYIYADILTLMDPVVLNEMLTGAVGELQMTGNLLFAGAILMEIPIAMVILSRFLPYKFNRWANIIAAIIKTLAVTASTFVGRPASYYLFFAVIEILTTLFIVYLAWRWKES